jgi:hypothetical protein
MKTLGAIFGVSCVGVGVGLFAFSAGMPVAIVWLQLCFLTAGTTGISLMCAAIFHAFRPVSEWARPARR